MTAYYNEIEPFKAEWLRELIRCGHIAEGEVDERSIADVGLDDLRGFTQCHFFAGIGVWSYALRLAGWPDDRPVWTGSCPCPGFSAAGKGGGFRDPRHLWPDWFRLIRERRPAAIFGEQADDAIGFGWLDLVQTDLEAADYAVGKAVFGACSVGAPHIRQRLYFGAIANATDGRGDTEQPRLEGFTGHGDGSDQSGWNEERATGPVGAASSPDGGSDAASGGFGIDGSAPRNAGHADQSNPLAGFWSDAIWLPCRDGKYRPTQPGIFPLANGAPARVGRLRGYGDAIVAQQAQAFIEAFMCC